MTCRLSMLWFALACGSSLAQSGDPLRSAACLGAMEALQNEEFALALAAKADTGAHSAPSAIPPGAQPSAGTPRMPERLAGLRRHAAGVCLGAWMDEPPVPIRSVQAPIHVLPLTGLSALRGRPPADMVPLAARGAPPPRTEVPTIISCDAGGCLASDGSRLPRVGGVLLGPRGVCAAQVAGQTCP